MFYVCNPAIACRWSSYLVAAMVGRTEICKLPTSFLVLEYVILGTVDLLVKVLLVGKHQCCEQERTLGLVCCQDCVDSVAAAYAFLVASLLPGYSK